MTIPARRATKKKQADLSRNHEIGGKTLRKRSGIVGKEKECAGTGVAPKWKQGGGSLLLDVMSPAQQEADLKLQKWMRISK